MPGQINIQPEPFEFEAESEWEGEAVAPQTLQVRARILWPALGFPAVIAPRKDGSTEPLAGNPSRCICALILSDKQFLGKEDVARYLRIIPWDQRARRYIASGQPGSFNWTDIQVRNDDRGKNLFWPKSDRLCEAVVFGAARSLEQKQNVEENAIAVSLPQYLREFYRKLGLQHLHEIRVSEAASAKLADGQYHLFWNDERKRENIPSAEMQMLLDSFARPRRTALGAAWAKQLSFFLDEYKYDYGALHPPYQRDDNQRRLTEVLHPVFIKRQSGPLNIAHVTDTHVDIRPDVYEENLRRAGKLAGVSFNNYNKDFIEIYREAKRPAGAQPSDVILLTGDLIDYGRGHVGLSFNGAYRQTLGQDGAYHADRNWFLFYYLLASGTNYTCPVYTILGNHDWRFTPYPPCVEGAPDPESLFHDAQKDPKQRKRRPCDRHPWGDLLRVAHGPGHEREYAYSINANAILKNAFTSLRGVLQALKTLGKAGVAALTRDLDVLGSPVQTTIESVAWYLLLINPFLDYSVKLASGHQILMLDWAEDEELFNFDDPRTFRTFGERSANALTPLQQWHVEQFVNVSTGRAKIIGIHAPPIGPFTEWSDSELMKGVKTYAPGADSRARKPNGEIIKLTSHPLFAIGLRDNPNLVTAEHGSFVKGRDGFIQRVADPRRGVRLVLSGHIHRHGLLVLSRPTAQRKAWLIRAVTHAGVRGIPPPAVARRPDLRETYLGPLFVNTTSAGPRGNEYEAGHRYVPPGYNVISLSADGTINNVSRRQIVPAATPPAQATPRPTVPQREAHVG
jgi:calcineurin-like phosphoesterase family protein